MSEVSSMLLGYRDAKHYAKLTANDRFPPKCDRIKMPKTEHTRSVELAHMSGEASMAIEFMTVWINNVDQPYEIMLGEIQLLAREKWNALHREMSKNGQKTGLQKAGLESLIDKCEAAIKEIREENERAERQDLAGDAEGTGEVQQDNGGSEGNPDGGGVRATD